MTMTQPPETDLPDPEAEPGEDAAAELEAARAEHTEESLAAHDVEHVPAQHPALMVSNEAMALIKSTLNPDLTDGEAMLFAQVCNRVGLDPFARQIHAVKRGGRMTIQTGIDGFRLISRRTGRYGGRLGPYFAGDDGEWKIGRDGQPLPWLEAKPPAAAMVGVVCKGDLEPTWGVALWSEYAVVGRGDDMWRKMPTTMLAKCAEAQAHRATFPAETSGLYTDDEMMQADARMIPAHSSVVDVTTELASEEVRFEVACRIAALPEESREALRERWKLNQTLRGRSVQHLPITAAKAAQSILNGIETEAKRGGWDMGLAHAMFERELLQLAETDTGTPPDEGSTPATGDEEAPSSSETGSEARPASDAPPAADEPPGAAERTAGEFTEREQAVIDEVRAMKLTEVDAELRRLGEPLVGSGQERRGSLAAAILSGRP